jgi:ABC-2 type transport system permease protein
MKWYSVFIKSLKEQIRDYWILLIVILLAPFFIFVYYLMIESENPRYDIILVNKDKGITTAVFKLNLGDSLFSYLNEVSQQYDELVLRFHQNDSRDQAILNLKDKKGDAALVIPENFTLSLITSPLKNNDSSTINPGYSTIELIGNITDVQYIIGAVLTEEIFNNFIVDATGFKMPIQFIETKLGFSGQRSTFELYVPGMLILAIIMMMFSASTAIVREPEIQTLKRLKLSNLSALEFLTGVSLVQIIVAAISLTLALFTAIGLGYEIIYGTLLYLILIAFLTSLSIISFSLLFAAFCRSIKDVAIIATFPMLIFMFFTGAAMPVKGGTLFTIGSFEFTLTGILSPTHSINALNKVLLLGLPPVKTIPDITSLMTLTIVYFILGVWAFNRRHMRVA